MHFAEALIYRWTNTQPHRVSTLRELNGHQCASCPLRRSPPRSSPLPQVSKSSWTCFDPSLINNFIPPRSRQLSTRRILVSHYCNIAPEVHWTRNPPRSRSRSAPTIRMRDTNVNTTPQSAAHGQTERRNGGRSAKVQAGCKAKFDSQRKDADA